MIHVLHERAPFPGIPRDDRPYVKFVIYGDGPLRSSLERLSSSLNAGVEFRGHSDNLREQLSSVDILLQPRAVGETFGIVNAEASNAGCVVLAYMRSGANESCGSSCAPPGHLGSASLRRRADVLGADGSKRCSDVRRAV